MRAAFVAIGLALLACLLPFGMHSLAAGPGALPQKMDVAALTCRDLDANGRPPLPPLWLDGYVSAQMNLDSVPVGLCAPNTLSRNCLLFWPRSAAARRT